MPTGAAGCDIHFLQSLEFGFADVHVIQEDLARIQRHAADGGIANGARLLKDFFEHEVLKAALLRHDRVPGDVLHLALNGTAFKVRELHALRRDHSKVAISEEKQVARVIENRGNIGRNKEFVFAQADHGRRTIAGGHNLVGLVGRDHRNGEHAIDQLYRFPYGFFERNGVTVVFACGKKFLNQVGKDLGVGFGRELVAFIAKLLLQREVVLDNAVVHDHDFAGAVAMRMRVLFRRTSMRGPARMADAVRAIERLQADGFFKIAQLSFGAAQLQAFAISGYCDPRGIVATVFEAPQAIDDDRDNLFFTHVSDYAAH